MSRGGWRALDVSLGVAVAVRLLVRDHLPGLAIVYYATPWGMIAAGFGALALFRRSRWRLIAAAVCLVAWFLQACGAGGAEPGPGDVHLRLWNAGNPTRDFDRILARVLDDAPDLLLLTDTGDMGAWLAARETLPGGYRARAPGGGLALLVAADWELLETELVWDGRRSRYLRAHLRDPAGIDRHLLLLDLDFRPYSDKRAKMRALAEYLRQQHEAPGLVAGDFNLPPDSVWFRLLPGYRSAFRTSGKGLEVSWPWPLPVLGLDQVWGDERITFRRSEYGRALGSDHRKLDVWFQWH